MWKPAGSLVGEAGCRLRSVTSAATSCLSFTWMTPASHKSIDASLSVSPYHCYLPHISLFYLTGVHHVQLSTHMADLAALAFCLLTNMFGKYKAKIQENQSNWGHD